jgi:hypothetical protein
MQRQLQIMNAIDAMYQESNSDWQCGYNMGISHCKAITRIFTERNCNTKLWQPHFLFLFAGLKYHGILVSIPFQLLAMKPKKDYIINWFWMQVFMDTYLVEENVRMHEKGKNWKEKVERFMYLCMLWLSRL